MLDEAAVREQWRALVKSKGGVRAAAEAFGLSAAYVSDVQTGRRQPGESVLNILGLVRVVRYIPETEGHRP